MRREKLIVGQCRICGEWIEAKQPCCRWDGITRGEGRWTCHAHPECYTITEKWDSGDWECHEPEGPRITPHMYWPNADVQPRQESPQTNH